MRRTDYHWIILATGFAILFFNGGSRSALGLMLKPMGDDLEWSRSALSLGITAYMLVSALAMPFVGRLADRFDMRWIMGTGVVVGAVGVGLMSLIASPWQLFAVYGLVFALGKAGVSNPIVSVMIVRWFPDRRGVANSVAVSGNAIGQLVIVGLLAQSLVRFGWRVSYAALGLANLAILAILAPIAFAAVRAAPSQAARGKQPSSDNPATTEQAVDLRQVPLWTSGQLWLLGGIYAICGFQDFFVATHVVAFALDIGFGALIAGNPLALMGVMGLLGALVSGFLADRIGPANTAVLRNEDRNLCAGDSFPVQAGGDDVRAAVRLHLPDDGAVDGDLLGEHLWVGAAGADQRNDIDDPPDQRGHRGVGRGTGVRHLGQLRPGLSADVDPVRSSNGRDAPGS